MAKQTQLQLQDILFAEGFGTRRVCAGLVQQGQVQRCLSSPGDWQACPDPYELFERDGLQLRIQGLPWQCQAQAYLMIHKPLGVECSQKPSAWPSVYTLLPTPLRQRPRPGGAIGVQGVGRLDQDTSGLLLLTDDGQWLHRLGSPRHKVPKVYEVTLKHAAADDLVHKLLNGVVLDDDPTPVCADACELPAPTHLKLTLSSGKYHQVKRMVAAAGNRVEALHRSQIGQLTLPPDLAPGQWRWLTPQERMQVLA